MIYLINLNGSVFELKIDQFDVYELQYFTALQIDEQAYCGMDSNVGQKHVCK